MSALTEFTNKYSKQLTLRNELIPVGKTLDFIKENLIVENDEQLNEKYLKTKIIVDDFLRDFINRCLVNTKVDGWQDLANALQVDDKELIEKTQTRLRANIVNVFEKFDIKTAYSLKDEKKKKTDEEVDEGDLDSGKSGNQKAFDYIFKKELFKSVLPSFLADDQEKINTISSFNNFSTYFRGFFENRKNIFSKDDISTAIAFRIVHDNFPKFLENINRFTVWERDCPQVIETAEKSFKSSGIIETTKSLKDYFTIESFNSFLSQAGIDLYNKIIGGLPALPRQEKVQGLNEYINLECQKNDALKTKLKNKKAIKMAVLFKQILSDREKSFYIDVFESDSQVIDAVKDFYQEQCSQDKGILNLLNLINSIDTLSDDELSQIYIPGKHLSYISKKIYSDWSKINNSLDDYLKEGRGSKELLKKYKSNKGEIEKTTSKYEFSLAELNSIVKAEEKFSSLLSKTIACDIKEKICKVNEGQWPSDLKNGEAKQKIKAPLDILLELYNELNVFKCNSFNKNGNFYVDYDRYIEELSKIVTLYNKTRNYCTKKDYSIDKFKLNFNSPQLAEGFALSKERDCLTVLFKKNNFYYVGILNKKAKITFESSEALACAAEDCYQKVRYYLLKDAKKFIPKCSIQLKEVKAHFNKSGDDYVLNSDVFSSPLSISKEIFLMGTSKAKVKKFQKDYAEINLAEFRESLSKWISFCKSFLKAYKSANNFDFSSLKNPEEYNDVNEFYKDVDNLCYRLDFSPIKTQFIESLVNKGHLYLFRINNKDFSSKSSGTKNLHTLYLEAIFDERNQKNQTIMLNGGAELFYRKESIDKKAQVVHKEGTVLVNKICKDGTTLNDKIRNEIYQYENKMISELSEEAKQALPNVITKKATHDITKDYRYTKNKFFFHCPITINYKEGATKQFNSQVLSFLRNNPDVNIIGIDRGERNLIYVTVINQKGEIIDSVSFNSVTNKSSSREQVVDYEEKLALREKERIEAKRSWDSISKIATLKEGYLSAIVHEICLLMVKHNAIVVLENLNTGFKRIRGGLSEKSVYQKFEKMLINKLNYFVLKGESDWNKPCGLLKGLQLSDQFQSFEKLGIQSGFIFYVPAAYTSKIDPTTGFANVINLSKVSNIEKIKNFFGTFNSISYCKSEDLFRFSFDLEKLSKKGFNSFVKFKKTNWDVFTFGERIVKDKNDQGHFVDKRISLTDEMKSLLNEYKVSFDLENNLLSEDSIIKNLKDQFWKKLFFIFKTTLQLRNSVTNGKEDVLISPVKNAKGHFFVSNSENKKLPQDCDANGAYHIALKGLMLLERNNKVKEEKDVKNIMAISNIDWFEYVQKRSGILK